MSAQLQSVDQLTELLKRHREATDQQGMVGVEVRRNRIQAAINLLADNHRALCDAMNADFAEEAERVETSGVPGLHLALSHPWLDAEVCRF